MGAVVAGLLLAAPARANPALADGMHALDVNGTSRHYVLRVPASTENPRPLVLVLHGGGGHGENAERMTGFTPIARREGFIVAYPEGSGRLRHALLTWNAGHCCGYAMEKQVDDVAFLRTLIDHLVANAGADPHRVYVTGMSNGAMMAHRAGIALAGKVAAIAPVVGTLFGDEAPPDRPVSLLAINGAQDASVPPAGGAPGGRFASSWDGMPALPAATQGEFWAKANGCSPTATATTKGAVSRWRYACPNGLSVERVLVADNGHAWPGGVAGNRRGDTPSTAFAASEEIWQFFRTHVLP